MKEDRFFYWKILNNKRKCFHDNYYENIEKRRYCYIQGPTGPQGKPDPQGIQGEIGPTGPRGENGPTTIEIGQTETVPFETGAEVTNAGTNQEVILNFKIPRGEKGDKGDQGDIGPRGFREK